MSQNGTQSTTSQLFTRIRSFHRPAFFRPDYSARIARGIIRDVQCIIRDVQPMSQYDWWI